MGVNAVLYYGPSIFESAGLSSGDSLFYQSLIGLVNVLTTVLALLIIDKVGRKKLVYIGVSGMIISLIMIGIYFIQGAQLGLTNYFLLVCFLLYIFFTAGSISAVIFVFLSEMYPTSQRKSDVSCRIIVMDWNIPHRTTHSLDVGKLNTCGNLLPVRIYVHPLHANCMETDARNCRKIIGRYRKILEKK